MKAMLLAAGYGKRLAPLTLKKPKPMLEVAGKPLLQHHIERLAACGIRDLVINTSWLAEQIEDYFGDGFQFGVSINWSREPQPLETGGGIAKALDLLGHQPFLLVNGDVWTDFPLDSLSAQRVADNKSAWLLLVNNPEHNPKGDFALSDGLVTNTLSAKYTFGGISVIRPQLLSDYIQTNPSQESFPLRDVLLPAIEAGKVMGAVYHGKWCDVGTVERYQALNNSLATDV